MLIVTVTADAVGRRRRGRLREVDRRLEDNDVLESEITNLWLCLYVVKDSKHNHNDVKVLTSLKATFTVIDTLFSTGRVRGSCPKPDGYPWGT